MSEFRYLLVDTAVLPEVFLKVVQAKTLLAQGKAKNVSQAAQMVGISRSAFYKYKDSVQSYNEHMSGNIMTLYMTLEDRPGILSSLLTALSLHGANIITVNQNIPVDGVAIVSVAAHTNEASMPREDLLSLLGSLEGVVEAKAI